MHMVACFLIHYFCAIVLSRGARDFIVFCPFPWPLDIVHFLTLIECSCYLTEKMLCHEL